MLGGLLGQVDGDVWLQLLIPLNLILVLPLAYNLDFRHFLQIRIILLELLLVVEVAELSNQFIFEIGT